jgi:hypothetical protein
MVGRVGVTLAAGEQQAHTIPTVQEAEEDRMDLLVQPVLWERLDPQAAGG